MTRFGIVSRMVKSFLAEVKSLGGVTQDRLISPKGLYSKPKGENAIIINLSKSRNQDVVMALQKEVELEDGDVCVTDDKNFIHFKFGDGIIEIKGDTIFDNNVTIKKDLTVNGKIVCNTSIEAGTTIKAGTEVTAGEISLTGHKHTTVAIGSPTSNSIP